MFNLDVEKLKNSDLIDRMLGFWEAYDKFFGTYEVPYLESSIQDGDYDTLYYALRCVRAEIPFVPISCREFSEMDTTTFLCWEEHISKAMALFDEQSALYCELIGGYSL